MKVRNLLPALSLTLCLSSIVDRVHAGSVQGDANGVTVEFTTTDKPSTPPPPPEPSDTPAPNAAIIFLPAGSDIASASSNGNVLLTDGATYSRWINGVVTKAFDVVQPDGYYNSPSDFVSTGDWVTINSVGAAVQWVQSSYCKDNGYSTSSSNVLNCSISAGAAVEQYQPPYIHYSRHWDYDDGAPIVNDYEQPLQIYMLDVSNQLWMQTFKAPDGTTDLGDSYPDPAFYKLDLATGVRQALDPNIADLLVNESGQFISTIRTPDNVGSTYTSYFQGKDITANNPVYLASSGSYLGRSSSVQNGQLIYSFTVYFQDGTSLALPVVVNSYAGWGSQGVPGTYRFDYIDQFDQVHLCANNDATGKPYGPDMCLRRKRDSQGNLVTPLQWEDVGMQQVIPPAPWTTNHQVSKGQWGVQAGYAWTSDDDPLHSVLFVPMSMAVDMNRDGTISLQSESLVDQTSQSKPYRFWINDDVDRHNQVDASGSFAGFDVQDDLNPTEHSGDLDWQLNTVPGTRDLEDWARLWINIGGLRDMIASGQISVGLKWTNVTEGCPAIKLIRAYEEDGGTAYLTSAAMASAQVTGNYGSAIIDASDPSSTLIAPPTSGNRDWDFVIPTAALGNLSAGNTTAHFLFEGCQRGKGALTIVLLKNNSCSFTKIGDGPSLWLDLKNIKEMYERWTVGDGTAANVLTGAGGGGEPSSAAAISQDRLPSGVIGLTYSFPVQSPEQIQYILFVHGWNMHPWEKDAFAETAYKRLYWQGYRGRFGIFEWPTTYHDHDFSAATDYDVGEYTAWLSATPLKNLLISLHDSQHYGPNVYVVAHSMGNVVTGEALRLAATTGAGQVVNTYVASQAAVPGQCYDPAVTDANPLGFGLLGIYGPTTPNIYDNWFATNSGGVGIKANLYNANDFALNDHHWQLDQDTKPDAVAGLSTGTAPNDIGPPYGYTGSASAAPVQTGFYKTTYGPDPNNNGSHVMTGTLSLSLEDRNSAGAVTSLHDRYEITAFAAEPRSLALGAVSGVRGMAAQNLQSVWPLDPFNPSQEPSSNYSSHPWHSAQFRFDNMAQSNYWSSLLGAFHLISNNQ